MTDTTLPANLTPDEVAEWQAACAATPGPYWVERATVPLSPNLAYMPWLLKWRYTELPTWLAESSQHDGAENDFRNFATNADPTTVRARLREISELRGALREILAIDKKTEVGYETDYEFGWNEALIRCQEIAEEAINAKT